MSPQHFQDHLQEQRKRLQAILDFRLIARNGNVTCAQNTWQRDQSLCKLVSCKAHFIAYFCQVIFVFEKNYFTSSDPHRDIILKHIRHKFWHSFCPSVSRFHQNYPLLLVPSPGSGSSSDHCDLSSQTDSNWLSLCLIQNNFRRPGVWRRLGAWKLRFERYKTIWLS